MNKMPHAWKKDEAAIPRKLFSIQGAGEYFLLPFQQANLSFLKSKS
jgi:hypothetical protein